MKCSKCGKLGHNKKGCRPTRNEGRTSGNVSVGVVYESARPTFNPNIGSGSGTKNSARQTFNPNIGSDSGTKSSSEVGRRLKKKVKKAVGRGRGMTEVAKCSSIGVAVGRGRGRSRATKLTPKRSLQTQEETQLGSQAPQPSQTHSEQS